MSSQILVVIDNLETITDDRIINFIIDAPAKVKFLVTSRKGIGQVERRYELKELKAAEAVYLFRQLARDKQLESLIKLKNEVIQKYVAKVSFYPLAIKWVIGQVARGKDINKVIDSIHNDESDISKFCFEQIFTTISEKCKRILFTISLMESAPTRSILQHITQLDAKEFEDAVEELILVSLLIPEQFQDESKEIGTKYNLLPLTKGYTRIQLNKDIDLRECLNTRIIEIESTVTESLRAQKEYKHSLYNFGAKSDEEKIATIIAQNAFQKYQTGLYEDAVEEYKRAVKTAPKFAPVYRNWGVMESYENHVTEATKLMEKASELDPNDPQIYLLWGNIYRKNGKFSDAHSKYEIAFKLAPSDPIILNAFGQSKSRLGLFEDANKLLKQSDSLNSEFQSIKHKIITKTSLAENLINWGDLLSRDKNFGDAENKFNEAISCCSEAIFENARDAKIFTAMTKANLKKGHLLLQMRKDFDALRCYQSIIQSNDETFKHSLIKLTALLDLCEYYLKKGLFDKCKEYFHQIVQGNKYAFILKQIKYQQLNERLRRIEAIFEEKNNSNGVIIKVSEMYGYVIIEDYKNKETYIGGANDFLPRLANVDISMVGLEVNYKQYIYSKNGKEKKQANYIKITGANKGYM
jgi:LuxR family transcriptional regulator, glucitol operon activator